MELRVWTATANKSDVRGARRKEDACLCLSDSPGKRGSSQGTAARALGDTRKTTGRDKTRKREKNRHTVAGLCLFDSPGVGDDGQRQDAEKGKRSARLVPRGPRGHTQKRSPRGGGGGLADPGAHCFQPAAHTAPLTHPANTRPRHTRDTPGTRPRHTRHTPATHARDTPRQHTPDTPGTHPPSRAPDTPRPPPVRDRAEGGLRAVSAAPRLRRVVSDAACALPVRVVPRYLLAAPGCGTVFPRAAGAFHGPCLCRFSAALLGGFRAFWPPAGPGCCGDGGCAGRWWGRGLRWGRGCSRRVGEVTLGTGTVCGADGGVRGRGRVCGAGRGVFCGGGLLRRGRRAFAAGTPPRLFNLHPLQHTHTARSCQPQTQTPPTPRRFTQRTNTRAPYTTATHNRMSKPRTNTPTKNTAHRWSSTPQTTLLAHRPANTSTVKHNPNYTHTPTPTHRTALIFPQRININSRIHFTTLAKAQRSATPSPARKSAAAVATGPTAQATSTPTAGACGDASEPWAANLS